jgi:hypothetical protein
MLKKIATLIRTCAFLVALYMLSGGPLWASGPTDCAPYAEGGQTGQPYTLTYQSLATETSSGTLGAGSGSCGVNASMSGGMSEQFYVGYYRNDVTHDVLRVDCRTGRVLNRMT